MEHVLKLESVQRSALRWGILGHFSGLVLVINAVPVMLKRSTTAPEQRSARSDAPSRRPAQPVGSSGAFARLTTRRPPPPP
jgi:hypothetical protein